MRLVLPFLRRLQMSGAGPENPPVPVPRPSKGWLNTFLHRCTCQGAFRSAWRRLLQQARWLLVCFPAATRRGCGPSPAHSECGPRRLPRIGRIRLRKQTRRGETAETPKQTKTAWWPSLSLFPQPVGFRGQHPARARCPRSGVRRSGGCLNGAANVFWGTSPWVGGTGPRTGCQRAGDEDTSEENKGSLMPQ